MNKYPQTTTIEDRQIKYYKLGGVEYTETELLQKKTEKASSLQQLESLNTPPPAVDNNNDSLIDEQKKKILEEAYNKFVNSQFIWRVAYNEICPFSDFQFKLDDNTLISISHKEKSMEPTTTTSPDGLPAAGLHGGGWAGDVGYNYEDPIVRTKFGNNHDIITFRQNKIVDYYKSINNSINDYNKCVNNFIEDMKKVIIASKIITNVREE